MLTSCTHMLAGSWQADWWIKTWFLDSLRTDGASYSRVHAPPPNYQPLLKRSNKDIHTAHMVAQQKGCEIVSSTKAVSMTTCSQSLRVTDLYLWPQDAATGNFRKGEHKNFFDWTRTNQQHYARPCNTQQVQRSLARKECWEVINILMVDQ